MEFLIYENHLLATRATIRPMRILYEDNHLIAVYKPAGTLVQGADTRDTRRGGAKSGSSSQKVDRTLMDIVKDFLKTRDKKAGNVFLGLIHRLDRNVSGVVLFAKTSKGASRLSEQFRDHTVEKIYHAWVEGVPSRKKATLKDMIEREGEEQYAELSYEVMETRLAGAAKMAEVAKVASATGKKSLLKISLKTGRHHQIRIQLSRAGHPICGDVRYGAREAFKDQHIELSATELHFTTATGDERVVVKV